MEDFGRSGRTVLFVSHNMHAVARLWERVARLRDGGVAVVFATQNLDEVERHADRVAALRDGRLVFTGPTDEYDRSQADTLFA